MTEIKIETPPNPAEYSYDAIPYPSHPYEVTHPDNIYTMSQLFGIQATLPDQARILELGCASGGNLIPMATQLPNARLIGVDLSNRQIAQGQETIDRLHLSNIELLARDFNDIDDSFGEFDYILCHGVFSWVPPSAQNRILEICRDRLAPNGMAYISYNAYPGWFMRGMIRQMMLHHIKHVAKPEDKVKQARALLSFIVDATEGQTTPYAQVLKQELEMLSKHSDAYLFHDHLEENNHPMFFYQFNELAVANNLQFVGESNLASMITSNLPAKAAEALTKLTNDLHHRSQYTDFVTNRMFRQSLLCRANVPVNRHLDEQRIRHGRFCGAIHVESSDHNLSESVEMVFKCANGRKIQVKNSALKALLLSLAEAWPASLTNEQICEKVNQRLSELLVVGQHAQIPTEKLVSVNLLQLLVRGDVEVRFVEDRFATQISESPMTSALTRMQAANGQPITTQRHGMVNLDPLTRLLVQQVDGTKTKAQLVQHVADLAQAGKLNISIKGEKPVDMAAVHRATIDKVLEQLRRSALLVNTNT